MVAERLRMWPLPSKEGRRGEEEVSEGVWCCRVILRVILIKQAFTMTYKSPATPAAECVCVIPCGQSGETLNAVPARLSSLITRRAASP